MCSAQKIKKSRKNTTGTHIDTHRLLTYLKMSCEVLYNSHRDTPVYQMYSADDEDSHDDEGKNQKEIKENPEYAP